MPDITISLSAVEKCFPGLDNPAVDRLTTTIRGGGVTGLAGPDGAGKTTLIRMLAGLLKPDSGEIRVAGFDPIEDSVALRAQLGYMPQKFGLYEDLSVMENLRLYAELRGLPHHEQQAVFDRLLTFTDLTRFTGRMAGKLSGGMKQKLGLACTLLGQPQVLLLDERVWGSILSPAANCGVWCTLADDGMLILWSTSYLDEAEQCRDVLLLNQGKVIYEGKPAQLTETMEGRSFLLSAAPVNAAASYRRH